MEQLLLKLSVDDDYVNTCKIIKKTMKKNKIKIDVNTINTVYVLLYLINLIASNMNKNNHTNLYDKFFVKYSSDNINIFRIISLIMKKYKHIGYYQSSNGIDCRCRITIDNSIDCFNSFYVICDRENDNGRFYRYSSNQKLEIKKIKINKNLEIKINHKYDHKERMLSFD